MAVGVMVEVLVVVTFQQHPPIEAAADFVRLSESQSQEDERNRRFKLDRDEMDVKEMDLHG